MAAQAPSIQAPGMNLEDVYNAVLQLLSIVQANGLAGRQTSVDSDIKALQALLTDPIQASYPLGRNLAKAWGYFTITAGTPTLVNSFNVANVAKVAAGRFTVTLAMAMKNTNYCVVCLPVTPAASSPYYFNEDKSTARTTTLFGWEFSNATPTDADVAAVSFAVFGD